MDTITLDVAALINSPSALTREQGAIVYDEILPLLKQGDKVILDFGEIESIITPFLNVSIGKLYENFSSEQLNELMKVVNQPEGTAAKFQLVINNAKHYYANKKGFDKIVKEVINN